MAIGAMFLAALLVATSSNDPTTAEQRTLGPPVIDGYRHLRTIGGPTVPNEPIDVLALPNGRILVADIGLERVVAYRPDGQIDQEWGDDGMSPPLDLPARLALDPEGNVYVMQLTGVLLRVLGDRGQEREALSIPRDAGQMLDRIVAIEFDRDGGLYAATNDPGMIYVLNRAGNIDSQIDPGAPRLIDMAVLDGGDLALSFSDPLTGRQGVRIISTNGEVLGEHLLENLVPNAREAFLAGIADLSGERIAALVDHHDLETPSEMIVLARNGEVLDRWQLDVENLPLINSYLPAGIAATPDDSVLVPVPWEQRIYRYGTDGNVELEIAPDETEGRFARLSTIATDGTLVYALDESRWTVQIFELDGQVQRTIQLPGGDPDDLNTGFFRTRPLLTIGPEGELFLSGRTSDVVSRIGPDAGSQNPEWYRIPESAGFGPLALATLPDGRVLMVDEQRANEVQVIGPDGQNLGILYEPETTGAITDIAVGPDSVFILEQPEASTIIWEYDFDGERIAGPTFIGLGEGNATRVGQVIAPEPDGSLLIGASIVRPGPEFEFPLLRLEPDGDILEIGQLPVPRTTLPDLAVLDDGTLLLAIPNTRQIHIYQPTS